MLLETCKVDTKCILNEFLEGSTKHPTRVPHDGLRQLSVLMGTLDVMFIAVVLTGQFLFDLNCLRGKVVCLSVLTLFISILDLK